MPKQYISTGLNMLDALVLADGSYIPPEMGGIPMYGWCGMRPWTRSIEFAARVGGDFFDVFNPWFDNNKISRDGLRVVSEKTPYNTMYYNPDGSSAPSANSFFTGDWKDSAYWRPHSEDFETLLGRETKGFYITGPPPPAEIWDGLFGYRDKFGFRIMWEPNGVSTFPEFKDAILELCTKLDMASFNLPEGLKIFELDTEEKLIDLLKNLGPELVLLRVGARGLYTITEKKAHFIPSAPLPDGKKVVDPTGCGNASTAGACVAWCEGFDPVMTGIMANISAMYNLLQNGPYPLYDERLEQDAAALRKRLSVEKFKTF